MKRLFLGGLLSLLSLSVCAQDFKVVGYYPIRAALAADVKTIPFNQMTHVNLAFVNPDSTGVFSQDLSGLRPFIEEARRHGVKVLFSIAGGGRHEQYHRLLQDDMRPMLIRNLMAEVRKYGVDGVDVDLEGRDIDEKYEPFVVELAKALKAEKKLITSAIAVYYKDQLSDRALDQYDFVNIMVYDRTGPWRPQDIGPHSTYEDAVEDLEYFGVQRNIPKERMTLGVPFYGYWFDTELRHPVISRTYGGIVSSFPDAARVDEWRMPDGNTIYYNGISTIRKKTQLAKEKAGGIMIWQVAGDATGPLSLLKAINDAAGR